MMNHKKLKMLINGAVFTAVAALGITVYQISTSPIKNRGDVFEVPEENVEMAEVLPEIVENTDEEEISFVESSGTVKVEDKEQDSLLNEQENVTDVSVSTVGESQFEEENIEGAGTDLDGALTDVAAAPVENKLSFSENTLMEWPVHGEILLDYNMNQSIYFPTLDQYKLSSAISVKAMEGTPVIAAADGKVHSISVHPVTGTTVTMELGDGYQAIYGQMDNLTVSQGDSVEKGMTIGYVAKPTKYYSKEGSNLYFAMKRNGEAIDPILYLP